MAAKQKLNINPYSPTSSSVFVNDIREYGVTGFVWRRIQKRFINPIGKKIFTAQKSTFIFQGKPYAYFVHDYNTTWKNERAIEIAIYTEILRSAKSKRVLEVGNVLSHYTKIHHDILDKYELADGIYNEDVVSFHPKRKYDLILAISTLEHVGWHENPYEKNKVHKALRNLISLLNSSGKLFFSVPLGVNDDLDTLLRTKALPITHACFMKRVTGITNIWVEATWDEVKECRYNSPYPNANAVMFGSFEK